MKLKLIIAAAAFLASATAFAQSAPAADSQKPAAQPAAPAASAALKSKAAKDTLLIAAGVALGAVAIDNLNDKSDDRPSSP